MTDVLDLDILRPKAKRVKIGGKEIDVGFIPVAITWDIDRLVQELSRFTEEKLRKDANAQKKALLISCELCAAFCYQHEELTAEWFRENTSVTQINAFVEVIKGTLMEAYAGIEEYRGNV